MKMMPEAAKGDKIHMGIIFEDIREDSGECGVIALTGEMTALIKGACAECLRQEAFGMEADINIIITGDSHIRELNRKHRGIARATDVLSFPMHEMKNGKPAEKFSISDMPDGKLMLGDIVISYERILAQAAAYGHSKEREAAFLAVHGTFHLLGYDHSDGCEENILKNKQEKVLEAMGLGRGEPVPAGLVSRAAAARENAYAPYSGFKVGAALTADTAGKIYTGCNVENISCGATCCAERTAIYKALSEGEKHIRAIAVSSDSADYIYPCGICLQVIAEFSDEETVVICAGRDGRYKEYKLKNLLPHAFGKEKTGKRWPAGAEAGKDEVL